MLFLQENLSELLENVPLNIRRDMWVQQDGAPAHYSVLVRNWLNENFPNKWIGRGGPFDWPPRSPDLTPLDFFFWGHLKNLVYLTPVNNINDLRNRIMESAATVNENTLRSVTRAIRVRLLACINAGGEHFENVLL